MDSTCFLLSAKDSIPWKDLMCKLEIFKGLRPQLFSRHGKKLGAERSFSQDAGSCPWPSRTSCRSGNVGQTDSKCADPQIDHVERAIFSYKDFPLNHILCTISGFSERNHTELVKKTKSVLKTLAHIFCG